MKTLTIAFLIASPLLAQITQMDGLILGQVFDRPRLAIRSIVGVPGAAYLGGAVAEEMENAIPNGSGSFLAKTARGSLMLWREGTATAVASDGVRAFAWCGNNSLVVQRSQPDAVDFVEWWQLGLNGLSLEKKSSLEAANMTFSFFRCEAATQNLFWGVSGSVYEMTYADGASTSIASIAEPVSFDVMDGLAYAGDAAGRRVFELERKPGGWESRVAVESLDEDSIPVAIKMLAQGRFLVAYRSKPGTLALFQREGFEKKGQWTLDASPDRIEAIGKANRLLLNGRPKVDDFLMLAEIGESVQLFFIPEGGGR